VPPWRCYAAEIGAVSMSAGREFHAALQAGFFDTGSAMRARQGAAERSEGRAAKCARATGCSEPRSPGRSSAASLRVKCVATAGPSFTEQPASARHQAQGLS